MLCWMCISSNHLRQVRSSRVFPSLLGAKSTMREVASSAKSYASFHYDIYPGHIQQSVSLIREYHYRIRYFPVMGVKRWGCMLLKIGGISRRVDEKKVQLIHLSTPWGATSQKFAYSLHLEKNSPSNRKKSPSNQTPFLLSHPTPNFYFPKQVSQSL